MPLTLVLGPANSAKAGEVLGAFAAASDRGAILVVPTAADADHYARELAHGGAVLGSVLTFSGLAFGDRHPRRLQRPPADAAAARAGARAGARARARRG